MKRSKEDIKSRMQCDTLMEFDIKSAVAFLLDSYVMQVISHGKYTRFLSYGGYQSN